LLKSLGSWFLYAVPAFAMERFLPVLARWALNLNPEYIGYSLGDAPLRPEPIRYPLMAVWPAWLLMIWAASGIALLSRGERARERPSFWRAASIAVIFWLPFRRAYLMLGLSEELLTHGALVTGAVAHMVAASASERWRDGTGPRL